MRIGTRAASEFFGFDGDRNILVHINGTTHSFSLHDGEEGPLVLKKLRESVAQLVDKEIESNNSQNIDVRWKKFWGENR